MKGSTHVRKASSSLAKPFSRPAAQDLFVDDLEVEVDGVDVRDSVDERDEKRVIVKAEPVEEAHAGLVPMAVAVEESAPLVSNVLIDRDDATDAVAPEWREDTFVEASEADGTDEAEMAHGTTTSDEGVMRFFWIDAAEEESRPGTVYLFGKRNCGTEAAPKFESVCVAVEGLERNLFVCPRRVMRDDDSRPVLFEELYKEVSTVLRERGVRKFRGKRAKRHYMYHFADPEVPKHGDFLKVKYGFALEGLAHDTQGNTFDRVFGTTSSALELLLLKRRIMGPCWLDVTGASPSASPVAWCSSEFTVAGPKNVCRDGPHPRLTLA